MVPRSSVTHSLSLLLIKINKNYESITEKFPFQENYKKGEGAIKVNISKFFTFRQRTIRDELNRPNI